MVIIMATAGSIGCQETEPKPRPAPERVRLNLVAPLDGSVTEADRVTVTGTIRPASATLLVDGESVPTTQGRFSTTVDLAVGGNVIDVIASAGRRRPAMAALRVTRQVLVRVPEVLGDNGDDAREELAGLGLKPEILESGSVLEDLLPVDAVVCSTDPVAGTQLRGGSRVEVRIEKLC